MPTPHNRPTLGSEEVEAAARVLASGWLAQGREVAAFEREVCDYLELPDGHAIALSSGTAALFMALWALAAKGKTVAIPAYSCAAVRNAVLMAGAKPIPVDVAHDSPHIDLGRAKYYGADIVIAAHMFGIPCQLAQQDMTKIPIIEDCAQAFGARSDGRPVGLAGTIGIFSFYATKMITAGGQGGMIVSRDKSLIDAVRDYREFDCRQDRKPRFNFQMTDLQAAVGRVQLSKLDRFVQRRREIHERYTASGLPMWRTNLPVDTRPCYYRAILRTDATASLIARLKRLQVTAIVPIEEWEILDEPAAYPEARSLSRTLVSIPLYPSLSDSEVAAIIGALSDFH